MEIIKGRLCPTDSKGGNRGKTVCPGRGEKIWENKQRLAQAKPVPVAKYDLSSIWQSKCVHFDIKTYGWIWTIKPGAAKERKSSKKYLIEKVIMEARSGLDDDGTMEDAMAEQDELESRVSVACLSALKALFALF